MRKRYIVLIAIAVICILAYVLIYLKSYDVACLLNDPFPNNYQDLTIYGESSTMMGGNAYVIYGNGSAYYYYGMEVPQGKLPVAKAGELTGEKIAELVNLLQENHFFCLKDKYEPTLRFTDRGFEYISVSINGYKKTVEDYGRSAPSSFRTINEILVQTVDSLPSADSGNALEVVNSVRESALQQ